MQSGFVFHRQMNILTDQVSQRLDNGYRMLLQGDHHSYKWIVECFHDNVICRKDVPLAHC